MDGGAWWAAVHGVAKSWTRLSDFTFTFHFHALEKEMATHSSILAWRIPGTGEPGGLPSTGLHRIGHDWSDLAAAAAVIKQTSWNLDSHVGASPGGVLPLSLNVSRYLSLFSVSQPPGSGSILAYSSWEWFKFSSGIFFFPFLPGFFYLRPILDDVCLLGNLCPILDYVCLLGILCPILDDVCLLGILCPILDDVCLLGILCPILEDVFLLGILCPILDDVCLLGILCSF